MHRFFFLASSAVSSTERTPGASTATGFSQKTCLPGLDRGLQMDRAEVRRRGQNHDIDAGGEHLLVGVEADEAAFGRDIDLARLTAELFAKAAQARLDLVGEGIADRDELGPFIGGQGLRRRAAAAAAAADQADLDRVVHRGMSRSGDAERAGQRAAGGEDGRGFSGIHDETGEWDWAWGW